MTAKYVPSTHALLVRARARSRATPSSRHQAQSSGRRRLYPDSYCARLPGARLAGRKTPRRYWCGPGRCHARRALPIWPVWSPFPPGLDVSAQLLAEIADRLPSGNEETVDGPPVQRSRVNRGRDCQRERPRGRHGGKRAVALSLQRPRHERLDLLVREHGVVPVRLTRVFAVPVGSRSRSEFVQFAAGRQADPSLSTCTHVALASGFHVFRTEMDSRVCHTGTLSSSPLPVCPTSQPCVPRWMEEHRHAPMDAEHRRVDEVG